MSYSHLTERERYVISHLHVSGCSHREIGRRLKRSHTTIGREIDRNSEKHSQYWYSFTHKKALARRKIPRYQKCQQNGRLMRFIERRLTRKWSPEQIANRLRLDYPDDLSMRISYEAIYQWIYQQAAHGGVWHRNLRRGRKKRRRQAGYGAGRGLITNRVPISERPECVEKRARYGDWEGDTILGRQGTGAIVTHVERKSLYLLAGLLDGKNARPLADTSIQKFKRLPLALRRTLTVDNGKEFADFKRIEEATALKIYFADPYASWQRGCNENTNGLLRQYFPKGMDFRKISTKDIANALRCLNNRPRKSLNYRTPGEVFRAIKSGALAT